MGRLYVTGKVPANKPKKAMTIHICSWNNWASVTSSAVIPKTILLNHNIPNEAQHALGYSTKRHESTENRSNSLQTQLHVRRIK